MVKNPLPKLGFDELLDWHIDRIRVVGHYSVVWVGEEKIEYEHGSSERQRSDFDDDVRIAVGRLYRSLKASSARKSSERKPRFTNTPRHQRFSALSVGALVAA